tara:strand:- start:2624 stop:3127 length:504 start_codon:yes stop_codon:yes gene_type:complete
MNVNSMVLLTMIISLLIPLFIGYVFITYIKSLENQKKCACSNNPKRKLIKYYGYVLIFSSIFGFISGLLYLNYPSIKIIDNIVKLLVLIIQFLAAYVIFTYSKLLEDNNCNCSDSWKRVFIKYYGFVITVMIGLIFLGLLVSFLLLVTTGDEKNILVLKKFLFGCGK